MRFSAVIFILAFVFSLANTATAQRKQKPVSYNKHYNEILPSEPKFKMNGWLFAPGGTYMLARTIGRTETLLTDSTTTTEGKFAPLGKPALYAEVGRYKMMKYSGLIKYIDYGLSYRGQRGRHKSTISTIFTETDSILTEQEVVSTFGYHYIEAFFNANHVWRISKYNFIQNSLGINAGYAFLNNSNNTAVPLVTSAIPGRIQAQLHYKIGFGIKMRGNWLLIPSIETPILNAYAWDNGRSSVEFINSRYRPVVVSLRFFFSRPANTLDCTPIKTREGVKMPSDMEKQGQMNQTK